MRKQLRPKPSNFPLERGISDPQHAYRYLFHCHRTTMCLTTFQATFSGRTDCLMGKGLSWSVAGMQLLGVDMASGKTLHAIHRRRGWLYSSVKQMAARLKAGEMDVTFLAHSGRKRKITKQGREKSRNGSEKCSRRASSKYKISS